MENFIENLVLFNKTLDNSRFTINVHLNGNVAPYDTINNLTYMQIISVIQNYIGTNIHHCKVSFNIVKE